MNKLLFIVFIVFVLLVVLLLSVYSFAYKRGYLHGKKEFYSLWGDCPSQEIVKAVIGGKAGGSSIKVIQVEDLGYVCQYGLIVLGEPVKLYLTRDGKYLMVNIFPVGGGVEKK